MGFVGCESRNESPGRPGVGLEVQDRNVDSRQVELKDRLPFTGGGLHLIARPIQHAAKRLPRRRIVVHDKKACLGVS